MNPMKKIKIGKITLNIGVGSPGDKLEKAMKLLENITEAKPVQTISMKRIPTWGLRPKLPIATKITIRGKKAEQLLKRLLQAVDNKLHIKKFDKFGNLSFGIPEYIDIPDVPYDAGIGVIGLEAAVTLERPGFRIKTRSVKNESIGIKHRITKEEAIEYMKNDFGVTVSDE